MMNLQIPADFRNRAILFLRIGFGVLYIYAAIDKLRHPYEFALMIENYRVIGKDLAYWAAVFMPALEVVTGLMLIIGIWKDAASVINLLLMTLFFILILQAYFRGLDIHCGCFSTGDEGESIGPLKLLVNFFYLIFSLLLVHLIFKSTSEAENALDESTD